MKKNLVIAGGGHAHMQALAELGRFVERGHEVTVIGPSDHHYYSGMGPGMLGGSYRPEEIRFATRQVVEKAGARFMLAKVETIDPAAQYVHCDNGERIYYDVLSCNLGSQVPEDVVSGPLDDVFLVKPIERLLEARQRILQRGTAKALRIGVVGGGPSAVEIAGNIWRISREPAMKPVSLTVFAGRTLMPDHPRGVRQRARKSLVSRGITITENSRITDIRSGGVTDAEGTKHRFDIIFVAIGVRPSRVFAQSGIATGPDGGMLVNGYLQSTAFGNIFGGGDCISFAERPLDKVGVYAVRQNPVLVHNLMAALEGTGMQAFVPGGQYLLIFNLGDGSGILYKWSLLFGGRLAFFIKDYIDRKFMRHFQAIE